MDKICYTARADLSELNGTYKLILKVRNGEFVDIGEITNAYGYEHQPFETEGLRVSYITDSIRYRLLMNVEHFN